MSAPDPLSENDPPVKPAPPGTPGDPMSCCTQGGGKALGVDVVVEVRVGVKVGGTPVGVNVFVEVRVGVKVGPTGVGVFVLVDVRVGVDVSTPPPMTVTLSNADVPSTGLLWRVTGI